jgi:hypothetical protein
LAAFSVARTIAGLIGAVRIRTPVASKNAFAIAAPMHVDGGSPEPLTNTPLVAVVLDGAVVPLACVVPVLTAGISVRWM